MLKLIAVDYPFEGEKQIDPDCGTHREKKRFSLPVSQSALSFRFQATKKNQKSKDKEKH
jgi:hypothetical protein